MPWGCKVELTIHYLYPFDVDMEMDPKLAHRRYAREVLRSVDAGDVIFEGQTVGQAQLLCHIYPFGIGMMEVTVTVQGDLALASRLAIGAEQVLVGRYPIPNFCRNQLQKAMDKARSFAKKVDVKKEKEVLESEIFTLVISSQKNEKVDADSFVRRNEKTLFGIVTGEASYAQLSEYAFDKEALRNIAYYEDEIILIRRYGAFIHSKEQDTLKDLIALALAQYFNVKTANHLLERSLESAQQVLEKQPPYYHFWKIPEAYQRLATEQLEFAKAKIALVDSLHTAHLQVPAIDSDWHLKSVHKEIISVFDLEEQAKIAMTRLETADSIYNHLGEQLSTAFFIILDFVFVTWLIVDLFGWVFLIAKTK